MIKHLRNYSVLADGSVFKLLRLVPESMMLIGQRVLLHNWKGLLKINTFYKTSQLQANTTHILVHNAYQGYYHWLLESLPRLLEAKQALPEAALLLPATCTAAFYTETLQLLGVSQITLLKPGIRYRVPDLALVYSEVTMGSYDSATIRQLRNTLLGALPVASPPVTRQRLYISRRAAPRRKVLNEREVEQALASHGFEAVCLEHYTFVQQVALCANAEILVSIHGAGLANMVFQPVSARIIELRKYDNNENIFFSELAQAVGLQYQLLYCKAQDESQSVQDADLWVDTQALLALLL